MAPESTSKKPWYKKPWVWGVIGALIVIGAVGNALGLGADTDTSAQAPQTAVSRDTPPKPAPKPAPAPKVEAQDDLGERVEEALLAELAVDSFAQLAVDGRESPLYAITEIETMYSGTIRVYYQEPLDSKAEQRDLVARHIFSLTAPTVDDLDTVVIRDATGIDSNHRR